MFRARNWMAGFGAHSGPSQGDRCRRAYLRLAIAQKPKAPEVGKPFNIYDLCEVRWVKETTEQRL
jgi:hypothetical protein